MATPILDPSALPPLIVDPTPPPLPLITDDRIREQQLRASGMSAGMTTPDRAAQVQRVAQQVGLPPELVDPNLDAIEGRARFDAVPFAQIIQHNPKLAAWLSDRNHAAIGLDDLPVLKRIDDAREALSQRDPVDDRQALPWNEGVSGRYARRGIVTLGNQVLAIPALLEAGIREATGMSLGSDVPGWTPLGAVYQANDAIRAEERAAQTYSESFAQRTAGSLIEMAANPAMLVAPLAGGSAAVAGLITRTAGQASITAQAAAALTGASLVMANQAATADLAMRISTRQAEGQHPGEFYGPNTMDAMSATAQGGIAAIAGWLGGLRGVLRPLNPLSMTRGELATDAVVQTAVGAGQGAAATIAQGAAGAPITAADVFDAAGVGGIGGGVMALGFGSAHFMAQQQVARAVDAAGAIYSADKMAQIGGSLIDSKVLKRNGVYSAKLLENTGTVYLQAEDLAQLAEATKLPVDELHRRLGVTPEQLADAADTGSGIGVRADLAMIEAAKAGTEAYGLLMEKAKKGSPDSMSLEEATAFLSGLDKQTEEISNLATGDGMTSDALHSAERVRDDVRRQLEAAGHSRSQAETNAAIWAARFQTVADRHNATASARGRESTDAWQAYNDFRGGLRAERALPEVLTSDVTAFGERLRTARTANATRWAADRASMEARSAQKAGDQTATADQARSDATGSAGDTVIQEAIDYLAAKSRELGRIPTQTDVLRVLGKEFGFKVDASVPLTPEQAARGALLRDSMRHRGFDLTLLGEEAAHKAASAMDEPGKALYQAAFHGTGNATIHERFSVAYVNGPGGEGTQAEGWGLYFSSKKAVARFYRDANQSPAGQGVPFIEQMQAYFTPGRIIKGYGGKDQVIAFHQGSGNAWSVEVQRVDKAGNAIEGERVRSHMTAPSEVDLNAVLEKERPALLAKKKADKGTVYTVDIPEDGEFLGLNEPLKEQSADIIGKVQSIYSAMGLPDPMGSATPKTGETIYRDIAHAMRPATQDPMSGRAAAQGEGGRLASERLAEAGIPGLRYLDGDSIENGGESNNYVIFDDSRISIQSYEQREALPERVTIDGIDRSTVNSEGKQLGRNKEEVWAFYKWFGESRAVDLEDRPVVYYHGSPTRTPVTEFKGGFFTTDKRRASAYTETFDPAEFGTFDNVARGSVYPVYLKIERPVNMHENEAADASLVGLMKLGHDGIMGPGRGPNNIAIVTSPNQVKSATGNRGTFDANDPSILNQRQGDLRGSYDPAANRIRLFQAENLSTFAHETGHAFLEHLHDLGSQAMPEPTAAADLTIVRKALAVPDGAGLTVDQHEQFARWFEAYLMEGKAPSRELGGVFARFSTWLTRVYRSITGLSDAAGHQVVLSPEIRGVMDRLLATDEQIAAAQIDQNQASALTALDVAAMLKMEAPQTEHITTVLAAAHAEAANEFAAESIKADDRARKAEASEAYATIREQVAQEVAAQPVYRAIDLLNGQPGADGEPMAKLNYHAVDRFSKSNTREERGIPAALRRLDVVGDHTGLDPELAASVLGYRSGDELMVAMASAPKRETLINAEAKRRLQAQHPELMPQRAPPAERAQQAIHGQTRAKVLRAELAAIGKAMGKVNVGQWVDDRMQLMERTAIKRVGSMRVVDTNPTRFRMAEASASKDAAESLRKAAANHAAGRTSQAQVDIGKAWVSKQREAYNLALYRAMTEAQKNALKARDYMVRMTEGPAQQRIGKAGGWEWAVQDRNGTLLGRVGSEDEARTLAAATPGAGWERTSGYQEIINGMLEAVELKPVSNVELQRRMTIKEFMAQEEENGRPMEGLDDLVLSRGMNWRQATHDELASLVDAIKMVENQARDRNKLMDATNKATFDEAAAQIVDSIVANAPSGERVVQFGRTFGESVTHTKDWVFSWLEPLGQLTQRLDGYAPDGPVWRYFKKPFDIAQNTKGERQVAVTAQLKEAFDGWSGSRMLDSATGLFIPAIDQSLTRLERIMVGLNSGNAGNIDRLRKGGLTESQHQAILDTLNADDARLIFRIGDIVNAWWPEIKAKQQRVTGIAPDKVDGDPITIGGIRSEGFYFPIVDDPMKSGETNLRSMQEIAKSMLRGSFTAATTKKSSTKARTAASGEKLYLSPSVISRHLNEVLHDLAFHEVLIDANRLLKRQDIKAAIESHHGPVAYAQFSKHLEYIAGNDIREQDALERAVALGVGNLGKGAMAYNVWAAIQNVSGVTQSMARVGTLNYLRAMAPTVASNGAQVSLETFVFDRSSMMRERSKLAGENPSEQTATGYGAVGRDTPNALRPFAMMEVVERIVNLPTWKAEYDTMMRMGKDEQTAILLADQAVVDAQGGKASKDKALIMQGSSYRKLFTMFYGWFNATHNGQRRALGIAGVHGFGDLATLPYRDPAAFANLVAAHAQLIVLPVAITMGGLMLLRPNEKRDKEDPLGRLSAESVGMLMATIPLLRELSSGVSGYQYSGPASMRGLQQLNQAIAQTGRAAGGKDNNAATAAIEVLGTLTGLPTVQAKRTIEGLIYNVDQGSANPVPVLFGAPK